MNKEQAKKYGIRNGSAAGEYCEVGDSDRREAACGCTAPNDCEDCLTYAAYESEMNAREWFAAACNDSGDRADALWAAYEKGVAIGILREVRKRLQRDVEAARDLQATVDETDDNNT